jgi:YVTN family beta-propeller protein
VFGLGSSSCHSLCRMPDLPSGAVTFLFTDIEGSTRLVKQLRDRYGDVLIEHQRLLRRTFEAHGGYEIDTQGDSFFVAFSRARDAVLAAVDGQRALLTYPWPKGVELKVRMGIHTGQAVASGDRYTGLAVHRAARIGAAAHGGQVLVSQATQTLVEDEEENLHVVLHDLGEQRLKDLDRSVRLFQVAAEGLTEEFPPLRRQAQLAEAAEVALAAPVPRRRGILLAAAALAAAAAVAVAVALLMGGEAAVTVRANSVGVIDPKSNRVIAQVPVGSRPGAIAFGDGHVWVANEEDRSVSRIDPRTRAVRVITLGRTPTGITFGVGAVWVAHGLAGSVSRIDPEFLTVTTKDTDAGAYGRSSAASVVATPGAIWVVFGSSVVKRLDPVTRRVVKTLYAGSSPSGITTAPSGIWIANGGDNTVSRIDSSTNAVLSTTSVTRHPSAIVAGYGAIWVAGSGSNAVAQIDQWSRTTSRIIPVGRDPDALAYGAGALWVANAEDGTVMRIDPATGHPVGTIHVGKSPKGLAFGAGRIWVTVTPE